MLDGAVRRAIGPALDRAGAALARRGAGADAISAAGLAFGLLAALLIALGWTLAALLPLLLGRLADGLDGAVARASRRTDRGGFLDIVCDFAFYGAVPLAFALADPPGNALASAFLLAAFYLNGASFLAYAVMAAKRGLETRAQGLKSLYYSAGLTEGTETIAFFVAFCLFPGLYPVLAYVFAALCAISAAGRIALALRIFR